MNFDEAFDHLMESEGGYVDHPADPGGETMWGITARVARQAGYAGPMKYLPKDTAKTIARNQYWMAVRADELPEGVRFDVFDACYNSGAKQAIRLLQRAVGVPDDGVIGPQTLNAVRAQKAPAVAMRFNAERIEFLAALPTWGSFGKGWARRVAKNLRIAATPQEV